MMLLAVPTLKHHLDRARHLQIPKLDQAGPLEDGAHLLSPEPVVRDRVLGVVRDVGVRDEVGDHEDAAGSEARCQTGCREWEVAEVVEAEADDGQVEIVVLWVGEGGVEGRGGGEEVADDGFGV